MESIALTTLLMPGLQDRDFRRLSCDGGTNGYKNYKINKKGVSSASAIFNIKSNNEVHGTVRWSHNFLAVHNRPARRRCNEGNHVEYKCEFIGEPCSRGIWLNSCRGTNGGASAAERNPVCIPGQPCYSFYFKCI